MTETEDETHNSESLAIMEVAINSRHYLNNCEYKIVVLIDHNNRAYLIDTKYLGSCQVC